MTTREHLERLLSRINGRGYKAYGELRGHFRLDAEDDDGARVPVDLFVDRVQADPFAPPSHLRLRIPRAGAGLPEGPRDSRDEAIALCDWLARAFREAISKVVSGDRTRARIEIDAGGQSVLERSAVVLLPEHIEARVGVGLPAAGRRILGRAAQSLLCDTLPRLALRGLREAQRRPDDLRQHVACVHDHRAFQGQLHERGLAAFVADGSWLPRESGARDTPMQPPTTRFVSPDSLHVDLVDTKGVMVRGMGIPLGVTLVVGGGYHGKTTLLRAIERGVYPHIPGDGRERVASDPRAVKIRAEDGRRVENVDLRPFIGRLPQGLDTAHFCSDDASGSTSQAASILEAVEAGARVLLFDEDSCASNLMSRDPRMRTLIHADKEPITPLVERVRDLYEIHGVSTLLVMGSSGDFFAKADTVIAMDAFVARDKSAEAKRIAEDSAPPSLDPLSGGPRQPFSPCHSRVPLPASIDASRGRHRNRIDLRTASLLRFGEYEIDLHALEQLVDRSQTRAIGRAILWMRDHGGIDGESTLAQALDRLDAQLDREGLDAIDPRPPPRNLARPRRYEVAAALNRLRSLRVARPG